MSYLKKKRYINKYYCYYHSLWRVKLGTYEYYLFRCDDPLPLSQWLTKYSVHEDLNSLQTLSVPVAQLMHWSERLELCVQSLVLIS